MKIYHLLLVLVLLISFPSQVTYSQNPEGNHTFKIIGNKRIPVYTGTASEMSVEYDSTSTDHLYISEYRKNGIKMTKTRLQFKDEKFNLSNIAEYTRKGVLLVDGIKVDYREDESVVSELLYKEQKLHRKTLFYPNGNKQMLICGTEKILNGDYRIWYPNGQLNFLGNYRYNLKNGEFQQFDEAGTLMKNGIYSGGKLISGEAVVPDVVFENPDQPARYIGGNGAFNDYLWMKTSKLQCLKKMERGVLCSIKTKLTIDKTGIIEKIDIYEVSKPTNDTILYAAFSDFPGFIPAMVENIPVSSILKINFIYNSEGVKSNFGGNYIQDSLSVDTFKADVYAVVENMPDFPGGESSLLQFLNSNIKYPMEALEKGLEGKVYVGMIIEVDGTVSNVRIIRGIDPMLDAEAIRVIKLMPKWIPGTQNGFPVRLAYTIPLNFEINN